MNAVNIKLNMKLIVLIYPYTIILKPTRKILCLNCDFLSKLQKSNELLKSVFV